MKKILLVLISGFFLLLTSCGFHPRGNNALPPTLRIMALHSNNPYGEFEMRLKKTLQAMGIDVVDSAPVTLQILQTNLNTATSSAGTSSQATVYTETYTATVALQNHQKHFVLPAQNVSATATMIVNAQQALNSTNQLQLLSAQLQQDVIVQIFTLLSSPTVSHNLMSQAMPLSHPHHRHKKHYAN